MNILRELHAEPGSVTVIGPSASRITGFRLSPPIPPQRLILAIGFALLAAISAASIALDVAAS